MQKPRYALVAYVKNQAGEFVENLRRELHPDLPHLAAHLTILPPRPLFGTENEALQALERVCGEEEPFEVTLGSMETFIPVTPTLYIRVESGADRMTALHRKLNTEALAFKEEWPYIPHLTIAKMNAEQPAQNAFRIACKRWAEYSGSRRMLLEKLIFVREDMVREDMVENVRNAGEQVRRNLGDCWIDLAPVPLGRRLVSQ
jgi:2'-5' RNA ligase